MAVTACNAVTSDSIFVNNKLQQFCQKKVQRHKWAPLIGWLVGPDLSGTSDSSRLWANGLGNLVYLLPIRLHKVSLHLSRGGRSMHIQNPYAADQVGGCGAYAYVREPCSLIKHYDLKPVYSSRSEQGHDSATTRLFTPQLGEA